MREGDRENGRKRGWEEENPSFLKNYSTVGRRNRFQENIGVCFSSTWRPGHRFNRVNSECFTAITQQPSPPRV